MQAPTQRARKAKKAAAKKRILAKTTGTPANARQQGLASKRHPGGSVWSKLKLHSGVTGLKAHDMVTTGVSVNDAKQVLKALTIIDEKQFYGVLGINARTMQRRAASARKVLDTNASDRALRLVSVTGQAIDVLGSQEAAERWLSSPAIGLDQRRPIELLRSTEGTDLVRTLLTRMDYGVYA
jgi:putative toxin-antitoxin system antitoxin component (TIGR02293 family)